MLSKYWIVCVASFVGFSRKLCRAHKHFPYILAWICLYKYYTFYSYHIIFGGAVVICFFDSYEDRSSRLTFTFCLYFFCINIANMLEMWFEPWSWQLKHATLTNESLRNSVYLNYSIIYYPKKIIVLFCNCLVPSKKPSKRCANLCICENLFLKNVVNHV